MDIYNPWTQRSSLCLDSHWSNAWLRSNPSRVLPLPMGRMAMCAWACSAVTHTPQSPGPSTRPLPGKSSRHQGLASSGDLRLALVWRNTAVILGEMTLPATTADATVHLRWSRRGLAGPSYTARPNAMSSLGFSTSPSRAI